MFKLNGSQLDISMKLSELKKLGIKFEVFEPSVSDFIEERKLKSIEKFENLPQFQIDQETIVITAEGETKIETFEVIERLQIEYGSLANAEKIKIKGVEDKYFIDI